MEIRKVNVIFNKNGRGFLSTKINIPVPWVRAMGITENNKELNLKFDGEKIIIEKEKEEHA